MHVTMTSVAFIIGYLFAFADSEAEDYFAILDNREELYSSGSQPKVTTISTPFDFHEVASDELRGLKVEYVNQCLVVTSIPGRVRPAALAEIIRQLGNWIKDKKLPIIVALNKDVELSCEAVYRPDVCALFEEEEEKFPCIAIEVSVSELFEKAKERCDEFLKLGSRFVAIFNFESTESASFSFHSKLRDRKWRKSEGPTIVPGAVFSCEEDCVLDRKEIEIDATRALRKRPLRREDV